MESPIVEISVTGKYYSLQLPEHMVRPFLEQNQRRVRGKARFKDKEVIFYATIQKIRGNYVMLFGKRYQKLLGIYPNDYFTLQFFEDTSKYGVDLPEELEAVLHSDPEAETLFESLSAGKKRGLIYAIARYAHSQTRIDKSIMLCDNLKRGVRDNRDLLKPQG